MAARTLVSPSLPHELTDRILDHAHDDIRTLSVCGLVCSSWLCTVRFHRFGTVRLRLRTKIIPFHNLLQSSPTVAPYQTHKMFQSLPKSLEEIEFNQVDLPTIGDLVILWTSLPCLRSFTTVEMLWFRSHEIPAELWESGSVRLSLTELHLRWTVRHADVLARWLAAHNVTGQLRACSLYILEFIGGTSSAETDEDSDVSDLSSMWMFSDPSCDHGGITDGGDLVLHDCNLAQCANLRELRFYASLERTRGYARISDHDLDAVPQFLTQLRAPSIKTLFFAFETTERGVGEYGFPALRSLGAIATPLSRNEFQGLQEVVVQLYQHSDDAVSEDVFAFIRRQLSLVDSRGILSIKVVHPAL
ncbi:hypothetical protein C8Q74DRAFT_1235887 [Fomes fomentarius]|nr:hypothetical protein C8Q74DRAFT_1235887 [Fomes fomentarius]